MLVGTLTNKSNLIVFIKDKCLVLNNVHYRWIIGFGNRDHANGLQRMGEQPLYSVNAIRYNDGIKL